MLGKFHCRIFGEILQVAKLCSCLQVPHLAGNQDFLLLFTDRRRDEGDDGRDKLAAGVDHVSTAKK